MSKQRNRRRWRAAALLRGRCSCVHWRRWRWWHKVSIVGLVQCFWYILIHEQAEYRQESTLNFDVNIILFQPRGVRKERVEEQVHRQTSKIREMIVKNSAKWKCCLSHEPLEKLFSAKLWRIPLWLLHFLVARHKKRTWMQKQFAGTLI